MDKKYMTIELADAELDAVAAGQDTFIGTQNNNSTINGGQFNVGYITGDINITNSEGKIIVNMAGQDLVTDINISDSEDSIVINTANQDLIIDNTTFNFDDSGFHMELTDFNGAGVDGGHVITFQGGANDVAVAEHDGHTTLSWAGGDCTLTVDAVDLTKGTDWFIA
jgi:hypothetical protein